MFAILLVCSCFMAMAKDKITYWKYAIIAIFVYTLNLGLRWGRGTDYNIYYYNYNDIIRNNAMDSIEPLWKIIIQFSNLCGLSWCHFVAFMSLFLIFSGVYFLQSYKTVAIFALPLFVISTEMAENLMRWFLGFSFILLGLTFLVSRKRLVFLFFSTLGFLVHYGLIINILGFLILSFVKKPIHPVYSIILFLLLFTFFSPDYMVRYVDLLQNIDMGERFLFYQQYAEFWLTGEALKGKLFMNLSSAVTSVFMIVYGYNLVKKKNNLIYFYNVAVTGAVTAPAMMQIELALRINLIFYLFQFLILAYIFEDVFRKNRCKYTYRYAFSLLVFLNIIKTAVLRPLFLEPNNVLYIWDAAGRHTLF